MERKYVQSRITCLAPKTENSRFKIFFMFQDTFYQCEKNPKSVRRISRKLHLTLREEDELMQYCKRKDHL